MDETKRWHTGGYMVSRDGDQCRIWLSTMRSDESAVVPYDASMPDWLFNPALDYFGDGVAFQVEIPWKYADAGPDELAGISWFNWKRQPYDDKDGDELLDMLREAQSRRAT